MHKICPNTEVVGFEGLKTANFNTVSASTLCVGAIFRPPAACEVQAPPYGMVLQEICTILAPH